MVSIIIPSRNEKFLQRTILDLLEKAEGKIEIIAILDGYWPPAEEIVDDPRVVYLHRGEAKGMRDGINSGVAISKGEYIMKSDAHCMFDKGFDVKLAADMKDDWIVIPRRKRLDADKWEIQDVGKPDVDYEFIYYPTHEDMGIKGQIWTERALERKDILIDENMTFQGSCYFMTRKHWNRIGGLNPKGYGQFVREAQEIGLKTWLGGGKVMTNKKTWYAHLHKGPKHGRGYSMSRTENTAGNKYCDDYWFNNRWKERKHDLQWLIDRFAPVPTWPETKEAIEEEPTTREELALYFAKLGLKVGAEIGVEKGKFTEVLCKAGLNVYAIDAWTAYSGYREHVSQEELDGFLETTKKRLAPYDCNIIKALSIDAVKSFKDESLDWVYIDGNHSCQQIMNDLVNWSEKVRKGGIVSGHDFRNDGKQGLDSCQVKDVVELWCKSHNIKLHTTKENNPSWYYIK